MVIPGVVSIARVDKLHSSQFQVGVKWASRKTNSSWVTVSSDIFQPILLFIK